jgi:phosphate transport system permease protein
LFFRRSSRRSSSCSARNWSPQTAIRADQVGSSGAFGAVPLFAGTLLISGIAMLVAVPIGLFSAIYLAEYADRRFRAHREADARGARRVSRPSSTASSRR